MKCFTYMEALIRDMQQEKEAARAALGTQAPPAAGFSRVPSGIGRTPSTSGP